MFTKAFFALAACGLLTNAHMVINTPVPYGQDSLTNSPLAPDGSDFPCKQRSGVYDVTKMNNIAVGSSQTLAFTGGATHGGGSCQLSITMDKEPTKSSSWKVIHSIEGGCPSNDTGNASEDASYKGSSVFSWQMPAGMPNGQYTLAWTWFNKIGNREMYMNCAPITVTGGSDDKSAMDALPDMFQANIGDGCTTVEGEDLMFPDAGKSVQTAGSNLGSSLAGQCTAGKAAGGGSGAAPTGYGSGSGSGSSPASSSAAVPTGYNAGGAASSPAAASSSTAAPTGYNAGGAASSPAAGSSPTTAPTGYGNGSGSGSGSGSGQGASASSPAAAPGGAGSGGGVVTVTTMATVTGSAGGAAPTGYSIGNGSSESGSNSGSPPDGYGSRSRSSVSSTGACTGKLCSTEGEVMCLDNGNWGLCNNGCAVSRALADGTSCDAGTIARRGRHLAHIKRQLARHHHPARLG